VWKKNAALARHGEARITIPLWFSLLIVMLCLPHPSTPVRLAWWQWKRHHGQQARAAHIRRRQRLKREL
jgi:hypothetical protein